ncbi:MAG: hypothetical protein JSU70_13145 [Phycisphaerales bacterium]|nr:MAG: hypothetical protein JSU70_13145 [Phycisphaerales bacterium]
MNGQIGYDGKPNIMVMTIISPPSHLGCNYVTTAAAAEARYFSTHL